MKKLITLTGLACLVSSCLYFTSCKKSTDDEPAAPATTTGLLTDTAYTGSGTTGSFWKATTVSAVRTGNDITITGTAANGTVTELNFKNITTTGSYVFDSTHFARYFLTGTNVYSTQPNGGGTFDITLINAEKAEGIFWMEALNPSGDYFAGVSGKFSVEF